MDNFMGFIMKHIAKDMSTLVAVGAGLLITTLASISYFRRKWKQSPHEKNSSLEKVPDKVKNQKEEDPFLSEDIADAKRREEEDLRTQYTKLFEQYNEEKNRREQAERKCHTVEFELRSSQTEKMVAEEKYEKLTKRYDVVHKKLKVAEERCKTLLDAMNDEEELLPLAEYDSDQSDEMSDEAEVEEYVESIMASKCSSSVTSGGNQMNTSDFELGSDVMHALVANAVGDTSSFRLSHLIHSNYDEDDDSLSDILAENMDDDDLDDFVGHLKVKVQNHDEDEIEEVDEENEEIISDHLQDVKSTRQFWEQKFAAEQDSPTGSRKSDSSDGGDIQRLSPSPGDLERSSPFENLRKQWNQGSSQDLKEMDETRNKFLEIKKVEKKDIFREESTDNMKTENTDVDEEHSPNFTTLREIWEQKMSANSEEEEEEEEDEEIMEDEFDVSEEIYDQENEDREDVFEIRSDFEKEKMEALIVEEVSENGKFQNNVESEVMEEDEVNVTVNIRQTLEENVKQTSEDEVTDITEDAKQINEIEHKIKLIDGTEIVENEEDMKQTDGTEIVENEEDIEQTDGTEIVENEGDMKQTDGTEIVENEEDMKQTDGTEIVENEEDIEQTDRTEIVENEEDMKQTDETEIVENEEDMKQTDRTEIVENEEDMKQTDRTEIVKNEEDIEQTDRTEIVENEEDMKQSLDKAELVEDDEDVGETNEADMTEITAKVGSENTRPAMIGDGTTHVTNTDNASLIKEIKKSISDEQINLDEASHTAKADNLQNIPDNGLKDLDNPLNKDIFKRHEMEGLGENVEKCDEDNKENFSHHQDSDHHASSRKRHAVFISDS